jgi:uncharacterized protein YggE
MKAAMATLLTLVCAGLASANVTVNGTGKVTYVPDLGHIGAGVSSDGTTADEAWQKNGAVVRKLFDVLKSLGIAEKDFKTTGLSLAPRYVNRKDQEPLLVGYTATYDLDVTVRELKEIGKVLDALVAGGANRRMNIGLGCSDPERLLDEARAKAATEARKKAEIYAAAAGADLGPVVSISEGQVSPWRTMAYEAAPMAADKGLPIAAGEQEMSVTVTVVYALRQPPLPSRP